MKLSRYVQDTSQLLRDASHTWTPLDQLVTWINQARVEVAELTGCIERHLTGQGAYGASAQPGAFIPGGAQPGSLPGTFANAQFSASKNGFQTIPNVERYPFVQFANPYLQQAHAGCDQIIDVGQIKASWGGSIAPALNWLPWDQLQAYARAYQNLVSSYPYWWSVNNPGPMGEVFMFPVPSQAGEMEWDVFCTPTPLYTDDDFEAIPDTFGLAVKFKAAALAFSASYRYAQAEVMEGQFRSKIGVSAVSRQRGEVPAYYEAVD